MTLRLPLLLILLCNAAAFCQSKESSWNPWKRSTDFPGILLRAKCDFNYPDNSGTSNWSYQLKNTYDYEADITSHEEYYNKSLGRNKVDALGGDTLSPGKSSPVYQTVLLGTCQSLHGFFFKVTCVLHSGDNTSDCQNPPVRSQELSHRSIYSSDTSASTVGSSSSPSVGGSNATGAGGPIGEAPLDAGEYACFPEGKPNWISVHFSVSASGEWRGTEGSGTWRYSGSSVTFIDPYMYANGTHTFIGVILSQTSFRFRRVDERAILECTKQ